jgi:hypothetical protein
MKTIALLIAVLLGSFAVQAQQTKGEITSGHEHEHMKTRVVDGRVNPEKIEDLVVLHEVFLHLAQADNETQRATLTNFALTEKEKDTAQIFIREFAVRFNQITKEYNDQADKANAKGKPGRGIASYNADINELLLHTQKQLVDSFSPISRQAWNLQLLIYKSQIQLYTVEITQ